MRQPDPSPLSHSDPFQPQAARLGQRWAIPGAGVIGWVVAFYLVRLWFPPAAWTNPIAMDDAAGHYFMARTAFEHGLSAVTHLFPDGFYPPLYAYATAALMAIGHLSVVTATALVWFIGAAVILPVGLALLARWVVRAHAWPVRAGATLVAPILGALLPGHPYQQVAASPLLPYGTALSLMPLAILALLATLDRLAGVLDGDRRARALVGPLTGLVLVGAVEAALQPRIAYTLALVVLPFAVYWLVVRWRRHRRLVLIVVAVLVVLTLAIAVAVGTYAAQRHPTKSIFYPGGWFPLYQVHENPMTSALFALTGGLDTSTPIGLTTASVATLVLLGLAVSAWRRAAHRPIVVAWVLAAIPTFAGLAMPGALGNILTAPWYHQVFRLVGTVPVTVVLVAVAGLSEIATAVLVTRSDIPSTAHSERVRSLMSRIVALVVTLVVAGMLALNPARSIMALTVTVATSPGSAAPTAMVTADKVAALDEIGQIVPPGALVFADPYTGFSYAYGLAGVTTYYPVGNLWPTPDRLAVNAAFGSGDPAAMTAELCRVDPAYTTRYVADFGAPYNVTYDTTVYFAAFHNPALYAAYAATGTLIPVATFPSGQAAPFTLYHLPC